MGNIYGEPRPRIYITDDEAWSIWRCGIAAEMNSHYIYQGDQMNISRAYIPTSWVKKTGPKPICGPRAYIPASKIQSAAIVAGNLWMDLDGWQRAVTGQLGGQERARGQLCRSDGAGGGLQVPGSGRQKLDGTGRASGQLGWTGSAWGKLQAKGRPRGQLHQPDGRPGQLPVQQSGHGSYILGVEMHGGSIWQVGGEVVCTEGHGGD